MLAEHQEKWIIISLPETAEESAISFSTKPDAALRRRFLSLFILILTVAMIIVALNDHFAQTSYQLVKMKESAAELEKDNQTLRIDIAKLKSPERIGGIAFNQLGLVLPDGAYISTAR